MKKAVGGYISENIFTQPVLAYHKNLLFRKMIISGILILFSIFPVTFCHATSRNVAMANNTEMASKLHYLGSHYRYEMEMSEDSVVSILVNNHRISADYPLRILSEKALHGKPLSEPSKLILMNLQKKSEPITAHKIEITLVLNDKKISIEKSNRIISIVREYPSYGMKSFALPYLGMLGDTTSLPYLYSMKTVHEFGSMDADPNPGRDISEIVNTAIEEIFAHPLSQQEKAEYYVSHLLKDSGKSRNIPRREVLAKMGTDAIPPLVRELIKAMDRDIFKSDKDVSKQIPYTDIGIEISMILNEMDIADSKATKELIPYLSHKQPLVRYWTTESLAGIGDMSSIRILTKMSQNTTENYGIKQSATEAIIRIQLRALGRK